MEIDYPAVMGSRERLWERFGEVWGWPPAELTYEADRLDLAWHEGEMAARMSFNYAVVDADEGELLGCVYIDPPSQHAPQGADAVASWWVVDRQAGGDLERAIEEAVPDWLDRCWGFQAVYFGVLPPPTGDSTGGAGSSP